MISYQEALDRIAAMDLLTEMERCPLTRASGRVLAENLAAKIPSPAFTNSAMDGFAVRHDEATDPLPIFGDVYAGDSPSAEIPQGRGCCRIMTGAPVPPWADTVVPVEFSTSHPDGRVSFAKVPAKGANIRMQGEDIFQGQSILKRGVLLNSEHILLCANFGHPNPLVYKQPQVAIFGTGDELREPGDELPFGAIYNSTKYFLNAALAQLNLKPSALTTLTDDKESAAEAISASLAEGTNLVITTGAVSAGDKDFIPDLAKDLGFETVFHKVSIRPGKPVFFAKRSNQFWVGLPGNPVSTMVGWHFFVRPFLSTWAGFPPQRRQIVTLQNKVHKPSGLRCFYRAKINSKGQAEVFANQGSAHLAATIPANGYVALEENASEVLPNTKVEAIFASWMN